MRNRLFLILAAAVLALGISNRSRPVATGAPGADASGQNLVRTVPKDHWAYPALQQFGEGKSNIPVAGTNGAQPVTRFEMAVLLSRIMEKLDAAGASKLPPERLELLDKLCREFRSDLDAIGADVGGIKGRLDELARKVEELGSRTPPTGAVVKQLFDAGQKMDAVAGKMKDQEQRAEALSGQVGDQGQQIADSHQKMKVYGEVLAKVLVRMARLEKSPVPSAHGTTHGLSRSSLNEIRGLIKDFAVDFERRLAQVEPQWPGRVQIPSGTRMPLPRPETGTPDDDTDHVLDGSAPALEAPAGPKASSGGALECNELPEDRI